MSDPFDRDKPLTIFDRLRIHEYIAEDRDALIDELEEEHEALKERHEVLQALLRGRLARDEDVPVPQKPGDRIPPGMALVLALVADMLDSTPEAKNYVQLAWTNGATGKDYELTVRYADGEMPAARAARLEKARDDARRDLARIYAECGEDTDGNDPEEPAGWVHLHPYALQAVKGLRTEVDEVRALADTYIDIVNRTARALGIPEVDEDGAMPSLHDVPERVAEVVREREALLGHFEMLGYMLGMGPDDDTSPEAVLRFAERLNRDNEPTDDDATQGPPERNVCGKPIPGSRRVLPGGSIVEAVCMDEPGHGGDCRFDARANTGGPA